jgi:hypothetical protein
MMGIGAGATSRRRKVAKKRKALGKKTRFEIFKRDSFACQYCGKSAPEVVLHVDHIHPVAHGGDDDLLNLITSCVECNLGKGARTIDDSSVVAKKKAQLDELEERRQQLEMMLEWQKSLVDHTSQEVNSIAEFWGEIVPGTELREGARSKLRTLIVKYGSASVVKAMRQAVEKHVDGSHDSAQRAWADLPKFAWILSKSDDDPGIRELCYARGILRNRMSFYEGRYDREFLTGLREIRSNGYSLDRIKEIAKTIKSITDFREWVDLSAEELSND